MLVGWEWMRGGARGEQDLETIGCYEGEVESLGWGWACNPTDLGASFERARRCSVTSHRQRGFGCCRTGNQIGSMRSKKKCSKRGAILRAEERCGKEVKSRDEVGISHGSWTLCGLCNSRVMEQDERWRRFDSSESSAGVVAPTSETGECSTYY